MSPLEFPTKEEKYAVWHKLAEDVKRFNIKAVIAITESWMTTYGPDKKSIKRHECINVDAISKEGEEYSYCIPFKRDGNRIIFDESAKLDTITTPYLDPIKRIWRS